LISDLCGEETKPSAWENTFEESIETVEETLQYSLTTGICGSQTWKCWEEAPHEPKSSATQDSEWFTYVPGAVCSFLEAVGSTTILLT